MKILFIANSFGQDACRYLHDVAHAAGEDITVVNLYIGGCSLYRHYRNMLSEEPAYAYEINGIETGLQVSLKQALLSQEWDYVVLQQSSPLSGQYETYQPYLDELKAFILRFCPPARILLHMTWTFAHGCTRFDLTPFTTPEEMLPAAVSAYEQAAQAIHADFMVPSGLAMAALYREKGASVYRDGFHAAKGFTRYMLACLWFMALTGRSMEGNPFRDLDVPADEETILLAQKVAADTLRAYGFTVA